MGHLNVQRTALDEDLSIQLLVGVWSHIVIQCQELCLYAIGLGGGSDVYRTAILLEILPDMNGIACSTKDVDGTCRLLQLQVFLGLDGVSQVACNVKRSATFHLHVTLAVETCLLRTCGSVGEGIGCTIL